jgi:hypothetical protein
LAAFDVFSHPSDHEGFSNSLGEAWLAGVPTVYTRDTGAVLDLGELGVAVSPEADGEEMARAFLLAYRNQDLVERARSVVESNYLVQHNIERWTAYLTDLHRQPCPTRIMIVASDAELERSGAWLLRLLSSCRRLDFCSLVLIGDPNAVDAELLFRIVHERGCPLFAETAAVEDVDRVVQLTRPDLILAWNEAFAATVWLPVLDIPIVLVARDTTADRGGAVALPVPQPTGLLAPSAADRARIAASVSLVPSATTDDVAVAEAWSEFLSWVARNYVFTQVSAPN